MGYKVKCGGVNHFIRSPSAVSEVETVIKSPSTGSKQQAAQSRAFKGSWDSQNSGEITLILKLMIFASLVISGFNTSIWHGIFYMQRNEPEWDLSWASVLAGCYQCSFLLWGLQGGITHHMKKKGWQGVRRPFLICIQLDLSPFHLSYPTHHPCDLLIKGEYLEIFPTISMVSLSQHCMCSLVNASLTYHVYKISSWDFMVLISNWRHFTAGNLSCVVKHWNTN